MNLKVEHAIIAVLVLALLYYVYSHNSLLNDISWINPKDPKLKSLRDKHRRGCLEWGVYKC